MRRTHIELFARWLEVEGKAKATMARRLSTISMFYRFCEQERLIDHSPAVHIRRPKLSYESNANGLDRNEPGALLARCLLGILPPLDDEQALEVAQAWAAAGLRNPKTARWPIGADRVSDSGLVAVPCNGRLP